MPDMKVFLELIAKSEKFQQGIQQGERSLKSFQGFTQRTGQFVSDLTQKFGFLGNAAAAVGSGLVFKKLLSISDYMPIDDALLRMRVNLKATGAEMDAFKKKVAYLAGDVGGDVGEVFQSAYKLSFNYNKDDILQIIKESDRAADAMKAPRDVVQDRMVQIMKLQKLPASEARGVADALVASRVSLESLDTILQRLALKGGAKKGYIEQLGMLRGLNMAGVENPRAVMSLNNVLNTIQDKAYILKQSGIKVEGRDQLEVLKDLQAYMLKMRKKLSEAEYNKGIEAFFGAGGKEAMDFVFSQMENFKKGREEMGHAGEIAAERNAAAEKTWGKQLEKIKGQLGGIKTDLSFIYDLAKKPVKWFADHPAATKTAGYASLGASGAVLAALGYGGIKKILGGAGKTGLGIAKGKVLEELTGVTPVFVTNMPAGGFAGSPPGGSKIGRVVGSLAAFGAGYVAGDYLNKQFGDLSGVLTDGKYKGEGWMGEMIYDRLHSNKLPMIYNDEYKRGGDKSKMFELPENKMPYLDMFGGKDRNNNLESLLHPEKPLIYYDAGKNNETTRGGDKNNFVFNFKFDKNGRVIGDTDTDVGDVKINLERGNFLG